MLLCPYCQSEVTALPILNSVSPIDFFLCVACAKLSERPKGANGRPLPLLVRQPKLQPTRQPRAAVH
jgi:hypothetical protein